MRILFAGTPRFAAVCLDALHRTAHRIAVVYTQPDRRAGRGRKWRASEVKQLAGTLGLPVEQPAKLSDPEVLVRMASYRPDLLVVVAYGLILPRAVLEMAPAGAINVHASLLPRWRGAAPIQRAILAGDAQTGVTIMRMEQGLDTGPMLLQRAIPIGARETAGELHDRLAELGAALLLEALDGLAGGDQQQTPQPDAGATYAAKLGPQDLPLDWQRTAVQLDRQVRALAPQPGARTTCRGSMVKLLRTGIGSGNAAGRAPGEVLTLGRAGIDVAAGAGVLRLERLQPEGGREMLAAEFARGRAIVPGELFGPGGGRLP